MGTSTTEKASRAKVDVLGYLTYERWRFPIKKKYRHLLEGKHRIEVGGPSTGSRPAR